MRGGLTATAILGRTHGNWGFALFYAVFVIACAVHVPVGLANIAREWLGPRRARGPLARPRVRPAAARDGLARGLCGGGMRRQQRLARARPPGVLGVPDAPPVRPRAGRVPAAAFLGAGAARFRARPRWKVSSLHRPAAVQARRMGPGGAAGAAHGGRRALAADRVRQRVGPAQELDRRRRGLRGRRRHGVRAGPPRAEARRLQ